MLRQPRFEGLRPDKGPRECHRERPGTETLKAKPGALDVQPLGPESGDGAVNLQEYQAKRNFSETPEPSASDPSKGGRRRPIFVIQEHHASRLHYDFRLEADGVLKSWAVPKQPSTDPAQKRLAVRVEDHPLAYAKFAGTIPEGQYGAGSVAIWDHGTYENLLADKPAPQTVTEGIAAGRLEFVLHGKQLQGRFALIRMGGRQRGKENWLLIKMKDEFARPAANEDDGSTKQTVRAATATEPSSRPRGSRTADTSQQDATFTHLDKLMYPEAEITKGDVLDYYRRIARRLLPYLKDRPVTLERLPEGLDGPHAAHFWQKHTPAYYPNWIPRVELPSEGGKPVSYVLVNDQKTLLYLVNQGTLTFHVGFSRLSDLDRPDFVLFDLDPGQASFADAVAVAEQLHELLKEEATGTFIKTSGKTGLHLMMPWEEEGDFDEARVWALGIAERVVEALPDQATVERSKAKRGSRVYVDVVQNAKGHHAVPPYVLRAVPAASVSTPLHWRELQPGLDPQAFNLKSLFHRLARQKRDPMAGLLWTVARR
ncbi:MAG: non-homologous end-joining DNA ligase [Gemmataceae bacterium]|nr:non-homologous end-joining DNA ligase [Gemmataceae bacterium]